MESNTAALAKQSRLSNCYCNQVTVQSAHRRGKQKMNNRANGRESSENRQHYSKDSKPREYGKDKGHSSYGKDTDRKPYVHKGADADKKSYGYKSEDRRDKGDRETGRRDYPARRDDEHKSYGYKSEDRRDKGDRETGRGDYPARRSDEHRSYGRADYAGKRSYRKNDSVGAGVAEDVQEVQVQPEAEDQEDVLAENTLTIEGRNAVLEAFRSGKTIDKIYVLDGCTDGPVATIRREARKQGTIMKFVTRERLDQISETGKHQGVIACAAAYDYSEIDDIFALAEKKGEAPFIFVLDNIEDPHNLGAMIRTANVAGAHGVIIPRNRAVGLTATVAKTSAGALNYTPVVKVTNIAQTIEELKKRGVWFACADMTGTPMYDLNLTGSIGLVIGNEGAGVGKLVREKCDMVAAIPMNGEIESLNASVAAGVLAYEIVRQRRMKK